MDREGISFIDDLRYAAEDIANTATNMAGTAHLQIQMRELAHRRETLCAQIGAALSTESVPTEP
jgi:hypothetical protein